LLVSAILGLGEDELLGTFLVLDRFAHWQVSMAWCGDERLGFYVL
jgi:hypothetical protein